MKKKNQKPDKQKSRDKRQVRRSESWRRLRSTSHPHFFPRKGWGSPPSPSTLPSQAGTRCVLASSGKAADPRQAVPPSPELGTVVIAETRPSAASRVRAHLHLRDTSVMVVIPGPPPTLSQLSESRQAFSSRYQLHTQDLPFLSAGKP